MKDVNHKFFQLVDRFQLPLLHEQHPESLRLSNRISRRYSFVLPFHRVDQGERNAYDVSDKRHLRTRQGWGRAETEVGVPVEGQRLVSLGD